MSAARYLIGDVFDVMARMPDSSVDLVLTSPPFLALRSYLPDDHPDKGREVGRESTPAEFLDTLLALTAVWDRLLAPHGSICVELGDTYAGHTGAGGDYTDDDLQQGQRKFSGSARRKNPRWPLSKSLCGIPTLYAWSLAYGRNLLTGEESPAGQWRIRNVVAWCRPNPPVGALGDKFRPATSYITIATKATDRWFDLEAVRTATDPENERNTCAADGKSDRQTVRTTNPAGAPPLDWWEVTTEPYSGSHYATWPRKLLTRPIESMAPREVCRTCGEPRRRIVERTPDYAAARNAIGNFNTRPETGAVSGSRSTLNKAAGRDITCAEHTTLGWTDCGHDNYRRGIVLDPFAGTGTTLAVATGLGRDAIGIDIDERNADLAAERVGMLLEVQS
jgi:hypothetical protein